MGGSHDKPQVIDAQQQKGNQAISDQNLEQFIKKAFKQASNNGRLYRDKFNEALSILESLNIRRIRDTPLGDRLFSVIDQVLYQNIKILLKDKSGFVTEDEYLKGITLMFNDKEKRIAYTFKAYDKDDDGKLSRAEFSDFLKESWTCAFRLLAEIVQRGPNPYNVNISKINFWAQNELQSLQKYVTQLFLKLDPQTTGFIDFQLFRYWILSDECSQLRAVFDGQEVVVPLNLYKLEQ